MLSARAAFVAAPLLWMIAAWSFGELVSKAIYLRVAIADSVLRQEQPDGLRHDAV